MRHSNLKLTHYHRQVSSVCTFIQSRAFRLLLLWLGQTMVAYKLCIDYLMPPSYLHLLPLQTISTQLQRIHNWPYRHRATYNSFNTFLCSMEKYSAVAPMYFQLITPTLLLFIIPLPVLTFFPEHLSTPAVFSSPPIAAFSPGLCGVFITTAYRCCCPDCTL